MRKQYIDITKYGPTRGGFPYPEVIKWSDGREFRIDEVIEIEFSLSNEYKGYRYRVKIGGIEKFIYSEDYRWYVLIPDNKVKRKVYYY